MSALAVSVTQSRVLIADDQPLILAGIRRTLERTDDLEIVGEASSASQLLAMIERRRPEIVMLGLDMSGASGCELVAQIHREWPAVKIIVLSASDERTAIDGAIAAGANAYILKSVDPLDLPSVIHQVATGAMFLPPMRQTAATDRARAPELTDRERTILSAICSGSTTSAISRELWVSEHTIKFHLTNVYRKLGVSNRAGAIRFAIEHGLSK